MHVGKLSKSKGLANGQLLQADGSPIRARVFFEGFCFLKGSYFYMLCLYTAAVIFNFPHCGTNKGTYLFLIYLRILKGKSIVQKGKH